MRAALLRDIKKLVVENIPDPKPTPREVIVQVRAVGVCGTDLHLYSGHGNYNLDAKGRPIPLHEQPQVLGHEFAGEVVETGRDVRDLKPGDRVHCDQGVNCMSLGRTPLCEYCASGDSHQCVFYGEHGITGLQGGMADYIAMPAVNCLRLPDSMTTESAALLEPTGCILHAVELADRTHARYTFGGPERIQNVLISGAGPAGLLFLQYLRNVKNFDGLILITDVRENNLRLAKQFGGTPVNVREQDLRQAVEEATHGERIQYLIEACGNPSIFEEMPRVIRKQATVVLYGHGHKGKDIGLLGNVLYFEPILVAPIGASGGFDPDRRPTTYRRARELVSSGKIQVEPIVTHRYRSLDDIPRAFERDFQKPDYIKGCMVV